MKRYIKSDEEYILQEDGNLVSADEYNTTELEDNDYQIFQKLWDKLPEKCCNYYDNVVVKSEAHRLTNSDISQLVGFNVAMEATGIFTHSDYTKWVNLWEQILASDGY